MVYDSEYVVLDESNAMKIVNEAYFGKTKEVLAIEQAVHDLRAPYIQDINQNFNINTYTPKINRDPNKRKLADAICNAFGFTDALIQVQSTAIPNFGTESNSYCIDIGSKKLKRSLKSSKSGFRYDTSADIVFSVIMPTGILVDSDITDAEITAALLHEVGHNFAPAISRGVYATSMFPAITWVSLLVAQLAETVLRGGNIEYTSMDTISSIITGAIYQTNIGHKIRSDIDYAVTDISQQIGQQCPGIAMLIGGGVTLKNMVVSAIQSIIFAIRSLHFPSYLLLPINALLKVVQGIAKPSGYEDEKFADAFASSYGYGAELNSFLDKFNDYVYSVGSLDKYVPVFSAIKEVYMLPFTIVLSSLDEHPSDAARASHTIKQLKRELANDKSLKPATRRKIEEDIKNIESLYEYHQNTMEGLPKGSDVKRLYQRTMFKVFGGDIRGKFVGTHVSDDIDKAYAATRESIDVWGNKERIGIIKENTDMMKSKFKDLMNF